jgi:hypothetical protein
LNNGARQVTGERGRAKGEKIGAVREAGIEEAAMRASPRKAGWIVVVLMAVWGLGEGAQQAQAQRYGRPRSVRVVHKFETGPPRNQLLFEGGLAVPLGNLEESFWTTDQGLGATNGYELGARYRYFVTPWMAISPAFHYVRFGKDSGVPPADVDLDYYAIQTSIYRYAVDLQSFVGSPRAPVRLYFTIGASLSYNKYRDEQVAPSGYRSYYEHGTTGFAVAGGAGLQFGPVEVSAVYHYDRFESTGLPSASGEDDWDWDHVTARAGISLGRF